jgi:heat shock protein HslJ
LKALAMVPGSAPYTPVCVIVEGRIDRETPRTGFAADYDGVISVARVFGRCEDTDIITHGDLQHHRWLLQSIDNKALDSGTPDNMIPELDFGERLTVTGNTGCNRFSGQAVLREEFFIIEPMASTRRLCEPAQNETERIVLRVLGRESAVSIDAGGRLTLEADQVVLRFRLSDWK